MRNRPMADDSAPQTAKVERLRSVYLAVTDGDTSPSVERQQESSRTRELRAERAESAVGPAALHGLDDAIDDAEPV